MLYHSVLWHLGIKELIIGMRYLCFGVHQRHTSKGCEGQVASPPCCLYQIEESKGGGRRCGTSKWQRCLKPGARSQAQHSVSKWQRHIEPGLSWCQALCGVSKQLCCTEPGDSGGVPN